MGCGRWQVEMAGSQSLESLLSRLTIRFSSPPLPPWTSPALGVSLQWNNFEMNIQGAGVSHTRERKPALARKPHSKHSNGTQIV